MTNLSATTLIYSCLTEKEKRQLSKLMDIEVMAAGINLLETNEGPPTSKIYGEIILEFAVTLSRNLKSQRMKKSKKI